MTIQDATAQVANDILKGALPSAAITEAAADYELNPALVARKFAEQHGGEAETFAAAVATREENRAAIVAADEETADERRNRKIDEELSERLAAALVNELRSVFRRIHPTI